MTSRDFCFWPQGYFEVSGAETLDAKATEAVKRHLGLVFKHEIDPSAGDAAHQQGLNEAHKPKIGGGTGPGGTVLRC